MTEQEMKDKLMSWFENAWNAIKQTIDKLADAFNTFLNGIAVKSSKNNPKARKAYTIYRKTKNKRIKNKQMKIMQQEFYKQLARGLVDDNNSKIG